MCIKEKQSGFTLIELSIVLVIIGLIVGGILTGQDLIRAAEVRATLAQVEKYNTAVRTFQNKYGYLPGDIPGTQASSFGLYYVTGGLANAAGCGDGNGAIQGWTVAPWLDGANFAGEIAMFFLHLSQAGLIDGMYGAGGANVTLQGATATGGSYSTSTNPPRATADSTAVSEMLPPAKLGKGNFFTIGSYSGKQYYILTGISQVKANADLTTTNNLSPVTAYTLDKKIDDGLPAAGKVFALDTVTNVTSATNGTGVITASANNCVNSAAYYTSSSTYANALNCSLRFEFQ